MHFAPDIDHPVLRGLFRAWVEARGPALLPPAEALPPSALPDRLARHAALYGVEADDSGGLGFRLGVVGAELGVRYGSDWHGRRIETVLSGQQVAILQRVLESVVRDRVVHYYRTMVPLAGGGALPYSKLLLPLGTAEGGVTAVLGGLCRCQASDDLEQNYQSRFAAVEAIEDRPEDFTPVA